MEHKPIRLDDKLSRRLGERRTQVLGLIAERKSIKQIAGELDISISAVNQHIKALKQQFGANSLADLWRVHNELIDAGAIEDCTKSACTKSQLPVAPGSAESGDRNFVSPVSEFNEPLAYRLAGPWETVTDAHGISGALNGAHAVWYRSALMLAIALGVFVLVLVGLGVAQGVTSVIESMAPVPPTQI